MSSFNAWGTQTQCQSVVPPRELFCCEGSSKLSYILENMKRLGVHSLPIIDPQSKQIEGMVDVLDIVCAVYDICELDRFNKNGNFNAGDVASAFIDCSHLKDALDQMTADSLRGKGAIAKGDLVRDQPAYFSGPKEPTPYVSLKDSLLVVLQKLGKDRRHRVPVVDSEDTNLIQNVVTQSDMCKYLYQNFDKLPETLKKETVGNFMTKTVAKVVHNAAMAEALYIFRVKKVHALAVEDRAGKFKGYISAHNFIRNASDLEIYAFALDEFFKLEGNTLVPELYSEATTIEEALKTIVTGKKARLFIGSEGSVSGVVSMRDLLKKIQEAMEQ